MKKSYFFTILLFFLLLLILEICFSLIFTRFIYNKGIIYLSLDVSHLIIIYLMIRNWKIDLRKLFKKIKIKNVCFIALISLMLVLIYPILNIPNLISSFLNGQTGIIKPSLSFFENGSFTFSKIYFLIRGLLIMPFFEEILYRGIIQNKLSENYTAFIAIVISSIFFGIGHMQLEQSVVTFFSGLLIGFIYYKTKNLTSAVMIHMFINVFANFTRIIYVDLIDSRILIYHLIIISALILLSIQFVKNYKTSSFEKEKV